MRILTFIGTPAQIGEAFGEASRANIHELYRRRVDNAIAQALKYGGQTVTEADMLAVAERSLDVTRAYDPAGFEELEGIARGADLAVVKVLAMNGLTDFRDVLSWPNPSTAVDDGGCTAIVAQADATDGGVLCGQSWDLATDNLPFVLGVVRKPTNAPATVTLTTDGCLSLIGMNEHGLCVGTTNVRTTDARPGVNYLSIIHRALAQRTFEDAVLAIEDAPRAGAHFYYVASADRATTLECSARVAHRRDLSTGVAVHANHCLLPENQKIEGNAPNPSTLHRQRRMEQLGTARPLTLDLLASFFADTDGGVNAICRDDYDGLNTNGAVVMAPARREIRLAHGVPSRNPWHTLIV
ncbi:MAG TPA: C45 family autoproteolytic acyltransferase/hydrolase [Myxococcota bacterium]|nr:C45 family autoproteolytic acyltransferase/hydrolase [Myxococcota bacterium]